MTLTNVRTLPKLSGVLTALGPWQAVLARAGLRVYPYQVGALVRSTGSAPTYGTYGRGDFRIDNGTNYVMACAATAYGSSTLYIPSTSLIAALSSVGATDDEVTLATSLSVSQYDYLFNLGVDTGGASPSFNGSLLTLYNDNAGQAANAQRFLTTGLNGTFRGWLPAGTNLVDLLVTDADNIPIVAIPFYDLTRESSRQSIFPPFYVTDVATSQSDVAMLIPPGTGYTEWVAPRKGAVTGVWARLSAAIVAGTITVAVKKNGTAIGLTAQLDSSNQFKQSFQGPHLDTFDAGDRISLAYTTASLNPTGSAELVAGIEVEV